VQIGKKEERRKRLRQFVYLDLLSSYVSMHILKNTLVCIDKVALTVNHGFYVGLHAKIILSLTKL
jgi:hypothetical protein